MTTIYSYSKVSTPYTVITMLFPEQDINLLCNELCTLNGITYVSVPDGVVLPAQPPEIVLTQVTLTPELREQIKAESPHVKLISKRVLERLHARYSFDDEMYFARIGREISLGLRVVTADEQAAMVEFGVFVESVRQWGRDERAKLGL